jgi:hypothetical protein
MKSDACSYLDFQIQQWMKSIPEDLRLNRPLTEDISGNESRSDQRLKVLLYVRGNHMRILIHRHTILSATSISKDLAGAQLAVDIAKDTIQVLAHLDRYTSIYHSQQMCFNYFLVSALAALFLAVCHAPSQFSQSCRDEFYMALDLVKTFSTKSFVSRRLWKKIKDLKHIGPQLGLASRRGERSGEPGKGIVQPSPATTSTNTLSQQFIADGSPGWQLAMSSDCNISPSFLQDGSQMSYELTNLFEAAGRPFMSHAEANITGHQGEDLGSAVQPLDGLPTLGEELFSFENNEEVSRIMSELF